MEIIGEGSCCSGAGQGGTWGLAGVVPLPVPVDLDGFFFWKDEWVCDLIEIVEITKLIESDSICSTYFTCLLNLAIDLSIVRGDAQA